MDEGEIIELECEVKGNPMPTITWYHNKRPIKETRNMRLKTIKETGYSQLTIFEIFKDDEGEIKCVAENKFGKTESITNLNVIGNRFYLKNVLYTNILFIFQRTTI